jgi:iron complex transport system ATP-binding protein
LQLTVESITASYNGHVVLRNLSLTARAGEIVGLVGPNGAGKSSLLRVISGTLAPSHGRILLDDVDLLALNAGERAKNIAVVPQSTHVPDAFSAGEVALMGRTPHLSLFGAESGRDIAIVQDALVRTDSDWYAERLIGELSGGEQQRVIVARALAQDHRCCSSTKPPRTSTSNIRPRFGDWCGSSRGLG